MEDNIAVKFIMAVIFAILACLSTGCGVSLGDSVVMGTTGYLEAVKGSERPMLAWDDHREEDKRKLDDVIRRY